jgi:hypothetical protein
LHAKIVSWGANGFPEQTGVHATSLADRFLIVDNSSRADEKQMLGQIAPADHEPTANAPRRPDREGAIPPFSVRNEWGNDIDSEFVVAPGQHPIVTA